MPACSRVKLLHSSGDRVLDEAILSVPGADAARAAAGLPLRVGRMNASARRAQLLLRGRALDASLRTEGLKGGRRVRPTATQEYVSPCIHLGPQSKGEPELVKDAGKAVKDAVK